MTRPDDGVTRPDDGVPAERNDRAAAAEETAARDAARRRRRLGEVFGEVLPDTTDDERFPGSRGEDGDDRLRREVPPHHG